MKRKKLLLFVALSLLASGCSVLLNQEGIRRRASALSPTQHGGRRLRGGGCGSCVGKCGSCGDAEQPDGLDESAGDFFDDIMNDAAVTQKSAAVVAREEELRKEKMALAAAAARAREDNRMLRRMEQPLQKENFTDFMQRVVTEWVDMHLDCCWLPVFEELDNDNRGELSAQDFRLMAKARIDVLNPALSAIDVQNFTWGSLGDVVSEGEIQRIVNRYMELDTDKNGFVSFAEFANRFLQWTVDGIFSSIDDTMEETFAQDSGKVEREFADTLEEMYLQLQEQMKPFLAAIRKLFYPHRTPSQRTKALLKGRVGDPDTVDEQVMYEQYPPDVLSHEINGTKHERSHLEARVQWMELEAIRYSIDWDRRKASAILTDALTGNPYQEVDESEEDSAEDVCYSLLPGSSAKDLPFRYRGKLSHSVGNYTQGYSRMLRASLLINRAEILKEECSAATMTPPFCLEATGDPEGGPEWTEETLKLLGQMMMDVNAAIYEVYTGQKEEKREWLQLLGRGVLRNAFMQRTLCNQVLRDRDGMIRDLLIAFEMNMPDAYELAAFYYPQCILKWLDFDHTKEKHPSLSFYRGSLCNCSSLSCLEPPKFEYETDELLDPAYFEPYPAEDEEQIERTYRSMNLCNFSSKQLQACKEPVRIPHDCRDFQEAMDLINAAAREGVSEEFEILVCGPRNFAWEEKLHTILHVPEWVDLEELAQEPFVRRRRLDSAPELMPQLVHLLKTPVRLTPSGLDHYSYIDEIALDDRYRDYDVATQLIARHNKKLDKPSKFYDVPLFGYLPPKKLTLRLRGSPNVQVWGEWHLSSISSGSIEGMTFSTVFHYMREHEEMEDYTFLQAGGEWNFTHADIRVGAGGALLTKQRARARLTWCCVGGVDDADFRAINGVVSIDSSACQAHAVVLELCGLQSGTAVFLTHSGTFKGESCLFQHNYNHVQIFAHTAVSLTNCTMWNHSSTLWVGHELCDEEAIIHLDGVAVFGSLWRNDWRPAICDFNNVFEYSKAARPDRPYPPQRKVRTASGAASKPRAPTESGGGLGGCGSGGCGSGGCGGGGCGGGLD